MSVLRMPLFAPMSYSEDQRPGLCARCGRRRSEHTAQNSLCPIAQNFQFTHSQDDTPMPNDSPPSAPPTIQSVAQLAVIAASNPPEHHNHSIFERVWAFFTSTAAPVAAQLIAANNPKLAPELGAVVVGIEEMVDGQRGDLRRYPVDAKVHGREDRRGLR